jgi:magnesium transporter
MPSFTAGVLLSIAASVFCSIGFLLQKLSHVNRSTKAEPHRYCNFIWLCGMFFLMLASMLDCVALGFVAQSVVAPLGAVTLVCNLLLGPLVLDERLTRRSIQATAIIIAGNLLSVVFFSSSKAHSVISSSAIVSRLSDLDMLAYSLLFVVVFFILRRQQTRFYMTIAAGMISATSMMTARMLSLMTFDAINGGIVKSPIVMAITILITIPLIAAQLRQMDECLARFEATYVVPISQSSMCLCSIAHGMFFFKEYRGLGTVELILFAIGVGVTLRGQYSLSRASMATNEKHVEIELEPERNPFRPVSTVKKEINELITDDDLLFEGSDDDFFQVDL